MSQLLKIQRKKFPYTYMIKNIFMELLIQTFLFKISNFNTLIQKFQLQHFFSAFSETETCSPKNLQREYMLKLLKMQRKKFE